MDARSDSASNVHISLTAGDGSHTELAFPERRIALDVRNSSIIIGRASKTSSKGFLAERDNGWFDSAVMSRKHAEIKADFGGMKVQIKDLGSLHGTYLNDDEDKIPSNESRELQDGDSIRFGVGVWRGSESFTPTTVKVGITFDHRSERASSTFRVPEGSDDGSDIECCSSDGGRDIDDDTEPVIVLEGRRVTETIDLTGQRPRSYTNTIVSHMEPYAGVHHTNVIDLSSPPQSPAAGDDDDGESESDSLFEIDEMPLHVIENSPLPATFVSVPEIIEEDLEIQEPADLEHDSCYDDMSEGYPNDDCVSMRHSSEESDHDFNDFTDSDADNISSTSSIAGSEACPYDMDSEHSSDLEDSEHESVIDQGDVGSESNDMEDSGMDEEEDFNRCIGLEDTSDEDDPADPFWRVKPDEKAVARPLAHSSFSPFRLADFLAPEPVPAQTVAPQEVPATTKITPPVTIGGLLNNEIPETYVFPHPTPNGHMDDFKFIAGLSCASQMPASQAQRQPSPSDVIMSKSFLKPTDTLSAKTGAELLGQKTGKHDFFAAREENKLFAGIQNKATVLSSVHSLCNVDHLKTTEIVTLPGAISTLQTENVHTQRPSLPRISHLTPLSAEVAPPRGSPEISNTHATVNNEETHNVPVVVEQGVEPYKVPGGVDVSRRTYLEISDIVEGCQQAVVQGKGKRKAKDISALSEEEEEWAAQEKSAETEIVAPISPTPSRLSEPVPAQLQALKPSLSPTKLGTAETAPLVLSGTDSTTTTVSIPEGRAPKRQRLRKIAERVGYAALGGVTAGAMIVGTLIYTAPTF